MKKQIIRLTENDLHKIIKESVNNFLMEHSAFDEFIANELKLPQDARKSHMTDEEIYSLLDKHKREQMAYDAEQVAAQERIQQTQDIENHNIYDDKGRFSPSNQYVNGNFRNIKKG